MESENTEDMVQFAKMLAQSEPYTPKRAGTESLSFASLAGTGGFSGSLHPLTSTAFESHKKVVPFHLLETGTASSTPRSVSLAWDENESFGIPSDMRRSGSLSEYERKETLYEVFLSNVWISTCVDVIAKRITSGDWSIEPIIQGKGKPKNKQILEAFFNYINDDEDCKQFIRSIATDLMIYGEAYAEIVRKGKTPVSIHKVDCQTITYDLESHGKVIRYVQRLTSNNEEIVFPPEDIIRWWLPSPRASKIALSPIERIKSSVYSDQSMATWVQTFFRKGARPPFWIKFPGNKDEAQRFVTWLRENFTGEKNAHVPMVLYQGAELVEVGKGSIDIDFKTGRTMTREEILAGYGVPPAMAGIIETGNIGAGSGESQESAFKLNTVDPIRMIILEKINYRLIKQAFGIDDYKFQTSYADYRSELDVAKIQESHLHNGLTTPNEERQAMGRQPYPKGGETAFIVAGKEILPVEILDEMAHNQREETALNLATKKTQLTIQQKQANAPVASLPEKPAPSPPSGGSNGSLPIPPSPLPPPSVALPKEKQEAVQESHLARGQDANTQVQQAIQHFLQEGVEPHPLACTSGVL